MKKVVIICSFTILLHSKGIVNRDKIVNKIMNYFNERNITLEIITIDKITRDDEVLAIKNNITSSKAAYINSIINDNTQIEDLVNKSISELSNIKSSKKYCDSGYTFEGNFCIKEIGREAAIPGEVCPEGYVAFEGICYEEGDFTTGENDTCYGDFALVDGLCKFTATESATGVCEAGEYNSREDKCVESVYIGDAYEFCRDSGRTLYEHKCLATKPTINGKCLGKDLLYNGKCLNTKNDYYMAEWKCPNGKVNSNADGSLLFEDNKCYESKEREIVSYVCNDEFTLEGKTCTKTDTYLPEKEKICMDGYTLNREGHCINYNNTASYVEGFVCNSTNAVVENGMCIIYSRVDAKSFDE